MSSFPRSPILFLLSAGAAAVGAAPPQGAPAFTIEQVVSAPFPSSLVAASGAPRVAWVMNARGVRNVWVAEAPEWKGRALTSFTEDDGEEISSLAFSADAQELVFVRGGPPNSRGELPNPLSRVEPRERVLFVAALAGGAPRRLAEGSSPLFHPRDTSLVFLQKGQVMTVPSDGSGQPERLLAARGELGSLSFSPDGKLLAFVSERRDHAFVGSFDLAARAIRWMDPSVDRDGHPVFSPDGTRLAFLRVPASRELFTFGPRREGEPWSIRVAEVATGKSREVFRADRGAGSVFQEVVAPSQILWAAGDRLVFPWEKTGWLQLHAVGVAGGPPQALTTGAFEVEYVSLSPDRTTVVFNSNEGDIDRRHIWAVPAAGGKPSALTTGTGIEWAPVMTEGAAVAFLRSSATRPAHPAIKVGGEPGRELAPGSIPADFPEGALVEPEAVVFTASDGMKIHGQLFRPRGLRDGERRPALLYFHGGSRRQMLLGFHYRGYYHGAYALNQYLARRGYVVLSVNYRSGTGYGTAFREAVGYGAHGASEFADVLGAGLYLRSRPDVDGDRIGLWGGSYGGYLTALGLSRASDLFAAGVDIHGVHDWNVVIKNFAPSYDPEKDEELARRAFESSPLASVKTWRSPVLLVHGDDDRNVPFSETVDLVEALRKQGVPFEQLVFPDDVHDLLVHARWVSTYRATADFFDRMLEPVPRKAATP
jgi:dipeptidyl aminopeptidase/acylaminoacyl peptidase